MTAWLFYYIDRAFDNYKRLYAFTDNKEYADEFKKQRSKENMICVKEKFKKSEFKDLESRFGKLRLSYGSFYTKSSVFGKRIPIKVLCTFEEEESVVIKSEKLWQEYSRYLFDPRAFDDKYLKALETLLFLKFYGFYKVKYVENLDYFYEPYYNSFGPPEGLIMEDFRTNYSYDDLKVFLKFFKNTFREDTKIKIDDEDDTEFIF